MYNKLLLAFDSGEIKDIFTVIDCSKNGSDLIGQMAVINADHTVDCQLEQEIIDKLLNIVQTTVWTKPVTISLEDQAGIKYRIFWDRMLNKWRAIVLGGGHISQPLVQILSLLELDVTVIDDRPDFANCTRFPEAQKVICGDFQQELVKMSIDNNTAVIIVTRGHKYDLECLRSTINSNARYLGMIGSRKRIREITKLVQAQGAQNIERRLRAPIGLDINAETPAEIALSIAAEVVLAFRGGSGKPLNTIRSSYDESNNS